MEYLLGAKAIIEQLNQNGYEAYIVGGYVRDFLLKRKSGDIDIATSALPEEVTKVFSKTIQTGLKHGTVTVIFNHLAYEVTTFRTDGNYVNHRKPEQVTFIRSLKEDILRRDFTMNALALTKDDEVIDYVQGKEDIQNKIIRTVGDPQLRFNEDALRMLRAFRFISSLGFEIESTATLAIEENAHLIQSVSNERIVKEFENMIKGEHFLTAIHHMILSNFHCYLPFFKNGIETIDQTQYIPNDWIEFLAICTVSGDDIEELPIPNIIKKEVKTISDMYDVEITDFTRPLLFRNGLKNCLIVNKLNEFIRKTDDQSQKIIQNYHDLPIKKQCDLKFKGDQIIEFYNRTPGIWIAEVLDDICLKVILGELENDYQKIKAYLLTKNY